MIKIRLTSARAGVSKSWRAGQTIELPDGEAQRVLDAGGGVPFNAGEPEFIPPVGSDPAMVVLSAGAAHAPAQQSVPTPPSTPITALPAGHAAAPVAAPRPASRRPAATRA